MDKQEISRSEKIIERKKEKARKISIVEGSAFSVSDGFGLRNIAPYALALNASNSAIGLLTSLPSLLGNFSQLFTHNLIKKFGRKKVVVFGVFLQAFLWLALLIPGLLFLSLKTQSNFPVVIFIAIYTALIVSGALAGPAWSSWMKDIVPKETLGKYFANRNKIAGIVAFVCMILAGLVLDYFNRTEVIYGFLVVVCISFIARAYSGYLFTKKYEPKFKEDEKSYFSIFKFLDNMPYNNFGRFVLFISLLHFTMAIASPFFAVYLLKERGLSYIVYMSVIMLMPIAMILTMTFWGVLTDKIGNIKIIKRTSVFFIFIPVLYFVSSYISSFFVFMSLIIFIEIMAGFAFGGFNLAVSNFLYKSVSREKMILCTSYMNFLNGFGVFLGATLGGLIASVQFWNPLLLVFLISAVGRAIVYFSLVPKLKEHDSKKHNYDKHSFISHLNILPRFSDSTHDVLYFKKSFEKSVIFRFLKN